MRRCFLFPVWLAVVLLLPALDRVAADKPKDKGPSFVSIIEANFARWDKNKDGKLNADEVNALINDHKITGDEAAAVAAIHIYQRDHKYQPVTRAELLAAKDAADERRDEAKKGAHFGKEFQANRNHIAKVPRVIFTDKAPSLAGLEQGNIGDCYLLSTIIATLHRNPSTFKRMFEPRPDGSCDVVFPNGDRVHVPKLTDGEIALGSRAGEQGLWLNVLEMGFGILTNRLPHKGGTPPPLDTIGKGGNADETITLFSGRKGMVLMFRGKNGAALAAAAELQTATTRAHNTLSYEGSHFGLACCGTPDKGKLPAGIVEGHAYAVLGYDTKTSVVHVMNPWGNDFKPKGNPGLQNGYEHKGGRFEIPLKEFVVVFEEVYYESTQAAVKKR